MAKRNGKRNGVALLDIPVEFGGVSIGESTARLGIRFDRSAMELERVDSTFCGRRLTCRVALGRTDDSPGQLRLIEDCDFVVESVADVKRFGVGPDSINTGLTFNLKEVDIETLAKFSKGAGRLAVDQVAEIPVDTANEGEDDDDDDGPSGALKTDRPWRAVQLDTLFHGAVLKSLKQGGIATVGDLADWTIPAKNGFAKQLADIKGIGEKAAEKIEARMLQFWADNPGAGQDLTDEVLGDA